MRLWLLCLLLIGCAGDEEFRERAFVGGKHHQEAWNQIINTGKHFQIIHHPARYWVAAVGDHEWEYDAPLNQWLELRDGQEVTVVYCERSFLWFDWFSVKRLEAR